MRKLLILGGLVGVVAALVVTAMLWGGLEDDAYQAPIRDADAAQVETPREQALARIAEEEAEEAANKAYEPVKYREFPYGGSRVAIWAAAQLHLLFAAFVLAVPIFAIIIEIIGYVNGDKRYDKLAYEFTKLLSVSFSLTATFGAILTFMLIALYPDFTNRLMAVFSPTFAPYVLLFFLEAAFLYSYYYGWGKFHPLVHISLGIGLNVVGTAIMFIANAWVSFMMTPGGVSKTGALFSLKEAFMNFTWMPINIHRLIANVAFGGSIAAAYAAWKYLSTENTEERAHYDWMGYIGNFVAIIALLPLPFAGYWLAREIYGYNQALGIMMMGGAFSWLFIIQAVLIGALFLAANFYFWAGMGRTDGTEKLQKMIKYLLVVIVACIAVWATPRSIVATSSETKAMGGSAHPALGYLGVMAAKNMAVNILIMVTFVSFLIYRRAGKVSTKAWAKMGTMAQVAIFAVGAAVVIGIGIVSFFVSADVRIGLSVPQVLAVGVALVLMMAIDVPLLKGARSTGKTVWGRINPMSQYALIFLAVTFTWLMGLMGYVRSGLRQHWHVYGVVPDTSAHAFTPTLGYATQVVSVIVLIFFGLIGLVFWLAGLSDKKKWEARTAHLQPASPAALPRVEPEEPR